ncbi:MULTISPECIES: MFS transporter [unclassified Microbacterium]|uniref:MFS transporter n=1 Tax=unclassified Microbacterium TaxID=2609290 RepID=UPI0012FB9F52|nr:MFS transporter [Microbacterium sp. MAH-37]MVQ41044.1 MFS transporter [Microbacterium sp. MAH-37]
MVYAPTVLFSIGDGAIIPLIPIIASRLGADVALAALVASALVVGELCGNLPAGWAVARLGERWTMIIAGLVSMGSAGMMLLSSELWGFTASVFLMGFCAAAFGLARHAFMTTRVPIAFRARALSLLGGSNRLGVFIGPFVAAALLGLFGTPYSAIWFFLVCVGATVVLVAFGPDPEKEFAAATPSAADGPGPRTAPGTGVIRTMWNNRAVLGRLGVAAAALSAVRSTRQVVLPLWGVSLGLDAQTIAIVVGVSGAIDFALFYASGQVMDRFGRLWAALPATILMGLGFLALSFTHDLDSATVWFVVLGGVLGLGNGLSSGILMTLGADTAPQAEPAAFLGSWRTLTNAGAAAAPLLVSAITAATALPLAVAVMGAVGLLGAAGFLRWIPRYVPRMTE